MRSRLVEDPARCCWGTSAGDGCRPGIRTVADALQKTDARHERKPTQLVHREHERPIDQPFDWDIANTNRAPIWNHPGDPSTYEGEAVSLPLSATDLDGDSLTLDAMNLPPGLYFDAPSETVLGAPDDESEGSYNVTLEA